MAVGREMPRYVCHKQVWALKIASVQEGTRNDAVLLTFHDDGYAPVHVDFDWYYRHKPEAGGYYVVYKDGYKSYSPAKAFEDGYALEGAAPAAQAAPQAGEDAASQIEHLDVENHRLRRAMQKIMARLADLLDEDQFGNIESIVTEAGVEPPEHAAQAAPAVPEDTPEAIEGTIQVLKECGGFTEQAPVIRQLRRYATLLAALTTQGESRGDQ